MQLFDTQGISRPFSIQGKVTACHTLRPQESSDIVDQKVGQNKSSSAFLCFQCKHDASCPCYCVKIRTPQSPAKSLGCTPTLLRPQHGREPSLALAMSSPRWGGWGLPKPSAHQPLGIQRGLAAAGHHRERHIGGAAAEPAACHVGRAAAAAAQRHLGAAADHLHRAAAEDVRLQTCPGAEN